MAFVGYTIGPRFFGLSLLDDGRVLATGGADSADLSFNGWDLLTWTGNDVLETSGSLPISVAAHAQSTIPDGAMICGGWTTTPTALATAYSFDATTLTWSALSSMARARYDHGLALLDDDTVLAIGGHEGASVFNQCEIYRIGADTWEPAGSMAYARFDFGLVQLPDGRWLVIGGNGKKTSSTTSLAPLRTCEIYDPITGLWLPLPPMAYARQRPIVAYLANQNAVVVAGGDNVPQIEFLDLATMRWRTCPSGLATTHSMPAGGVCSDDTLLVAGGLNGDLATEKVNFVVLPGTDDFWTAAGINDVHRVDEVPDSTHIIVHTKQFDYVDTYIEAAPGATVTPMKAIDAPTGVPGPFSFDLKSGFALTKTESTTALDLNKGTNYPVLALSTDVVAEPANLFPDETGYLVFNFGFQDTVGPVKYLGRYSETELVIDASFKFPATLPAGVTVTLLSSRTPFQPPADQHPGNFYATSSAAGRVAAQKTVDEISAAGLDVDVTVVYPGDRGLGGEGLPAKGVYKVSDKVGVWGGDSLDEELVKAREE